MLSFIFYCKKWSGKRGSNSRPRPWQGRALPTELFPHIWVILNGARGQTWTGTPRKARDFKSLASTDSATRATFKLSALRTDGAYYRDFRFAVKQISVDFFRKCFKRFVFSHILRIFAKKQPLEAYFLISSMFPQAQRQTANVPHCFLMAWRI